MTETDEKFKITLGRHLSHGWILIALLFVPFIAKWYLEQRDGIVEHDEVIWYCSILLILPPVFLQGALHLNYYVRNRGDELVYDRVGRSFSYRHRGMIVDFSIDDVAQVVAFVSFPVAEDRTEWLPWDGYSHVELSLRNGKILLLTSLMVPGIRLDLFADEVVEVRKNLYRWAKNPERKRKGI